mgnify:CR=1 FL=1
MIRGILFFIVIFALAFISISVYRDLTNREKLQLSKLLGWSAVAAWVALVISTAIVYFF